MNELEGKKGFYCGDLDCCAKTHVSVKKGLCSDRVLYASRLYFLIFLYNVVLDMPRIWADLVIL